MRGSQFSSILLRFWSLGVKRLGRILIWVTLALLGAGALGKIALERGESLNAMWFVIAAVCCYLVAFRLYSAFVAARLLALDDTRATPSERHDDGRDFVPTNKWVLFGHHFAAIAGPRRQVAWANGAGRGKPARRIHRPARCFGHHGDFAGGDCSGGGERAEIVAVGNVHIGNDDPHCAADRNVFAFCSAGARAGRLADGSRPDFVRGFRRAVGG